MIKIERMAQGTGREEAEAHQDRRRMVGGVYGCHGILVTFAMGMA
jgi:hypothetical protein